MRYRALVSPAICDGGSLPASFSKNSIRRRGGGPLLKKREKWRPRQHRMRWLSRTGDPGRYRRHSNIVELQLRVLTKTWPAIPSSRQEPEKVGEDPTVPK